MNFAGVHSMAGISLHSVRRENTTAQVGRVYMDPTSPFTDSISQFMILYPHRSLVIRPTSPEALCYMGQISYTESLLEDKYAVQARIDLLDVATETPLERVSFDSVIPFTIDFSSGFDIVQNDILDRIQDVVSEYQPIGFIRSYQTTGFGQSPSTRSFQFVCGSDYILDQLPIVQYTIMSSSDATQPLTIVRLYPRDYIAADLNASICKSKIRSLVALRDSGGVFGMPFISHTAIYIDITNGVRIGFGEPL